MHSPQLEHWTSIPPTLAPIVRRLASYIDTMAARGTPVTEARVFAQDYLALDKAVARASGGKFSAATVTIRGCKLVSVRQ